MMITAYYANCHFCIDQTPSWAILVPDQVNRVSDNFQLACGEEGKKLGTCIHLTQLCEFASDTEPIFRDSNDT
jgi:hypothetical protein